MIEDGVVLEPLLRESLKLDVRRDLAVGTFFLKQNRLTVMIKYVDNVLKFKDKE